MSRKAGAIHTARYRDSSIENVAAHLSFTFGLFPYYSFRTVLPDWSIGLEMQYYALFPFIMLATRLIGFIKTYITATTLCLLIALIYPEYLSKFPMPSMIIFKLSLFISGMLVYKAAVEKKIILICLAMLSPLAALGMGYFISPTKVLAEEIIMVAMSILLSDNHGNLIIKKIVTASRNFLSKDINKFLGNVSYSVYLLHLLIIIPIIGNLAQQTEFVNLHPLLRFIIAITLSIPITYFVAFYLFKYIEKNGIQLGKVILNKNLPHAKQPLYKTEKQ